MATMGYESTTEGFVLYYDLIRLALALWGKSGYGLWHPHPHGYEEFSLMVSPLYIMYNLTYLS